MKELMQGSYKEVQVLQQCIGVSRYLCKQVCCLAVWFCWVDLLAAALLCHQNRALCFGI